MINYVTRFRLQDINPLQGLREGDIPRMALDSLRGDLPDFAWLIYWLTRSNHAIIACVKKLQDALKVMDWDIRTTPKLDEAQQAIADQQAKALRAAYDRIENLKDACQCLAMGEFYGYAHCEKIYAGGLQAPDPSKGIKGDPRYKAGSWDVVELRFVSPWFWSRAGFCGKWLYNPRAEAGWGRGTPINLRDWVIREVDPPLGDVLARAHHKMEMADDDWAQHDDTFAVPPIFIELPPDVPESKEAEYQEVAEQIVSDGRGAMPHGSKVHTVTVPDAGESFAGRMGKWESAIVLAVTRGKLTMLTDSTGIGQGASEEHGDAWDDVAAALALDVSETLQKQFDLPLLQRVTPGQPVFAWFEFAREAEKDAKAHLENAKTAKDAGFTIAAEELSEKTGYKLLEAAAPAAGPGGTPAGTSPDVSATSGAPATPPAPVTPPTPKVEPAPGAEPVPATDGTNGTNGTDRTNERTPIARPSRAGEAEPSIVQSALATYVGLEEKWLAPIKAVLDEVEAALLDETKTVDEIEALLDKAAKELPDLLGKLDTEALAEALENAGTPGAIQGLRDALNAKTGKKAPKTLNLEAP